MTEKMKPSGIAWIGDIPRSWKCKKLKYLISEPLQYGANEEGCDFDETYPRYIRITDIEDNNQLKSDGKQSLLPSVAAPYVLNDGDVLFARSGATVGKTFIYSSEVGCAAFAGYLIRASVDKKQILPKYLYYCTINGGYDNWKNSVFTQATIQNIGADKYAQFSIAFPSTTEQQCIADFLDIQCAKIDSVIADIEKQIETLQKYKKSLITEAVTKGLDRSVLTKDSGIEWIGEIPEHWVTQPIKYRVDFYNGDRGENYPSKAEMLSDGVPFINAGHLLNDGLDMDSMDYISEEKYKIMGGVKLQPSDILYCLRGSVGKNAILDISRGTVASSLVALRSRTINAKYLYFTLNSHIEEVQRFLWDNGTAQPNLSADNLGKFKICIPSMKEQEEIVKYLNAQCTTIDDILEQKKDQLRTIQQHKKSLIYEYVTGKKRVTEVN